MERTPRYNGVKLGPILEAQGRKRRWLAQKVGVSEAWLSYLISGQRTATKDVAERISDTLNVPLFLAFEFAAASELVAEEEGSAA